MLTDSVTPPPHSDRHAAALAGPLARSVRSHPAREFHPSHEHAALANALDDGLMPDEVAGILAGRRVTEAFPIRWGESPEAYASRAVAEMFVAYLQ
ncbi:hypothetical protein MKK88_13645 [Methylobacterium sp. E-005]|uniref:hypothetical protein n=1 Tax=Methylobacterium sp. E-005 TaxID=2836549 RepID=UPI001FBA5390|nr:hypothetical protein [Methylobacterium sp. E-005]MCJ2087024.1 hypothetical protein [Methylobacterium sp. E-005]